MSPLAPLGCDGFSDFVFDNLDSFEEYKQGVLSNVPQLSIANVFLMVRLGLWSFESQCHSHYSYQE